ncbi:MAG: T9SS type A sorting domain-containing protein, partial [Saprospiraceae bacterium]|nr:T9SS type A sorting domain-containing protein [Saprospiraceae bacterium]
VWAGSAQVYFNKQIDWEHNFDYFAGSAIFTDTSNILLAGGSSIVSLVWDSFLVAKVNKNGDMIWKKSFNAKLGASGNTANLLRINDEFSLIHGNAYVLTASPPNTQYFFIKIRNDTGEKVWVKEIGENYVEEGGYKLIQTDDGGFALAGYSFPFGGGQQPKMLILKIDSLGNQVFRKDYSTDASKEHRPFSIVQTSNGGYILQGFRGYFGTYPGGNTTIHKNDWVIIGTDGQGNQQWEKVFEPFEWKQHIFYGRDIIALADGTYLVAGLKGYAILQTGVSYFGKYFFAKFDELGNIVDSITLPDQYYFFKTSRLKQLEDGNIWVIGAERDSQNLGQTGLIMKITPELQVLWRREYRVSPPESMIHDIFNEGAEMPDGGFVLCGLAFGPLNDSTNQNGWVIRVDSFGCLEPGCQLNSAIEDPPAIEQNIGITLSPNPTSGQARLALTHDGAVLLGVRVMDVQGRVVSDVQFLRSAGWRECVVDLDGEPAGVYVVQVRTSEGRGVRKIVKQ